MAPPPTRSLAKTYLAILLPMMLTNLLQSAAGVIDGVYLGQMIGVDAIAAVSAFFPVFFFLLALIIGLSAGATVLIGQAWGAGERAKVRAIAGTALAMMLAIGLTTSVLGALSAPHLMSWLGTPANVFDDAVRYARLMLIGMPVVFLMWLSTSMSRGVGDATTPLRTLALATSIALAATPAFIRGWFGLPRLGVASPAVSTWLAFTVALAWMFVHWRRTGHALAPSAALLRQLRIDRALAGKILRIGAPIALQMLTMAVAELVLLGLVNRHGSHATAAYGAVTQVMSWMQLPAMSVGITASILASHMIGAGRSERVSAVVRIGLRMNVAVTGAIVVLTYGLAPVILGLFLTDRAVQALALQLLHIAGWSVIVLGGANVLVGVMRGSGAVLVPTSLGMAAIVVVELPLAYTLNATLGMTGIWWSYAAAFVAMLVLQAAYYRMGWRRRAISRLI
jgi:putative MATE family efflux protein